MKSAALLLLLVMGGVSLAQTDPFRPYKPPPKPSEIQVGMEGIRVVGIVLGYPSYVLVEDARGQGYVLKVGSTLRGATVTQILPDRVLLREPYRDEGGSVRWRKIILRLPGGKGNEG